jgi:hypothetical protein
MFNIIIRAGGYIKTSIIKKFFMIFFSRHGQAQSNWRCEKMSPEEIFFGNFDDELLILI